MRVRPRAVIRVMQILILILVMHAHHPCLPGVPSAPESVKYGSETCESQSLQFELKYQYRVPLFTIYSCSVEI